MARHGTQAWHGPANVRGRTLTIAAKGVDFAERIRSHGGYLVMLRWGERWIEPCWHQSGSRASGDPHLVFANLRPGASQGIVRRALVRETRSTPSLTNRFSGQASAQPSLTARSPRPAASHRGRINERVVGASAVCWRRADQRRARLVAVGRRRNTRALACLSQMFGLRQCVGGMVDAELRPEADHGEGDWGS